MIYERKINLIELLKEKSHFLLGPRSTGKSFLIGRELKGVPLFDLLDTDLYQSWLKRPSKIREVVLALPKKEKIVVIDEIQKIPALLDEIHFLIENTGIHFLLTGSSARKLKRHSTNLLAGRAWMAHMHPLTSKEITNFDLLRYLNYGGLPQVYNSPNPKKELKNYVSLYMKEEIQQEALLRSYEQFSRFLDSAALLNAEEINYQNWASDTGVPAKTIANYIDLLKDTLMAFELYAYTKTKKRKAIQRSKFYFFDVGVANQLTNCGEIKEKSIAFGKAFEHFVIQELRAMKDYLEKDWELCYWRSLSQMEVDLILGNEMAIEIKATENVTRNHLKGLKALREEGLIQRYIVVSLEKQRRVVDGIEIYPWREFLTSCWNHEGPT